MALEKAQNAIRRGLDKTAQPQQVELEPKPATEPPPTSVQTKTQWKPKLSDGALSLGREKTDTFTSGPATFGQKQTQSLSLTGDQVSASAEQGFSAKVKGYKGYGLEFSVTGKANASAVKKAADGMTTWTASADVSVQAKTGVSAPVASISLARTEGVKTSFSVRMPTATAAKVDPGSVNPFTPETMPKGSVVTLDGTRYSTNEFKATFKKLATASKLTDERGVSVAVEKLDGERVRVTSGPTEAIKAFSSIGVDLGVASASVGRADNLGSATLQTAEFDLSNPDGLAAYNNYLISGELPTNGAGVANRATIEKLDYSSQPELAVSVGSYFDHKFKGGQTVGSRMATRHQDGTSDVTSSFQYPGNVPFSLVQKYDVTGDELRAERRYVYTLKIDPTNQFMLEQALGPPAAQLKPGQTVTLSYNEADMTALMMAARKAATDPMAAFQLSAMMPMKGNKFIGTVDDFAIAMARNVGQTDIGFADRLRQIGAGLGSLAAPIPMLAQQ